MQLDNPLRILVVDDSALYRKVVADALSSIGNVTVVGSAANGKIALARLPQYNPDLLTLDVEMPEMSGIDVLEHLKREKSLIGAIMLSSLTLRGGAMTMKALELGAFDFLPKPDAGTMQENLEKIRSGLFPILQAYSRSRPGLSPFPAAQPAPAREPRPLPAAQPAPSLPPSSMPAAAALPVRRKGGRPEAVLIGVSTGGPVALTHVIPKLPGKLGVPVLVVQHMPPLFTKSLAENLNGKSMLTVVEAEEGMRVEPDHVYIAPGGRQMKVARMGDALVARITDDPPENSCRPSVDVLFRSALAAFGGNLTAVIMTGMGGDGAKEMVRLKEAGAHTIAQDQASCVVFGMPKEAIDLGAALQVSPLGDIAQDILKTLRPGG